MSTTRILLPLEEVVMPAANPATLARWPSAGTPPANAPAVTFNKLLYDPATDQFGMWMFRLPSDYLSGSTIVVKWYADVNTGAVIWSGGIASLIDGTTNLLTGAAFIAADLSATVTVPATVGLTIETSWALTTTGVQGGQLVQLFVGRRAGAAGDTATGSANIVAVEYEYNS